MHLKNLCILLLESPLQVCALHNVIVNSWRSCEVQSFRRRASLHHVQPNGSLQLHWPTVGLRNLSDATALIASNQFGRLLIIRKAFGIRLLLLFIHVRIVLLVSGDGGTVTSTAVRSVSCEHVHRLRPSICLYSIVGPRFTNAPVHEQFGWRTNFPCKKTYRMTNGFSDYKHASWQQRQAESISAGVSRWLNLAQYTSLLDFGSRTASRNGLSSWTKAPLYLVQFWGRYGVRWWNCDVSYCALWTTSIPVCVNICSCRHCR
jgi:hypothetical protein